MYQPIYANHQSYKQTNVSLVGLHPTSKKRKKLVLSLINVLINFNVDSSIGTKP